MSAAPGRGPHGNLVRLGFDANDELTLAPAIEYVFSKRVGVIGGVWYTVRTQNSPAFYSPILGISANW